MKRLLLTLVATSLVWGGPIVSADAQELDLYEWLVNIDGSVSAISAGDPVPPEMNISLFDDSTGLGTIVVTIEGGGGHTLDLFLDHEIDEAINTYFNEYGAAHGTPAAGQSWEIDEPGYVFGDIYDNFWVSDLDNSNGVPQGFEDDPSMALGWDFDLAAGEIAEISMVVSETAPLGFYLEHTDPDSNYSIYSSSSLDIIPEPSALVLLGMGAVGLLVYAWRRRRSAV